MRMTGIDLYKKSFTLYKGFSHTGETFLFLNEKLGEQIPKTIE
jgi:hypothetical protein